MDTTSESLLLRVRQPGEAEAWSRFVKIYSPILYGWAGHMGLSEADAADLVQDVFATLVQKLPHFIYDPGHRFRHWLWAVMRNRLVQVRRRRQPLPISPDNLDRIEGDVDGAAEEADFQRYLIARLVPTMRKRFPPTAWAAFWGHVVEGKPASQVADELGLSVANVYKSKARVLARLQAEFADLLC
jgi:RNA polymerase sigma-70 factor (ECF subfamily)